jgi:hypothetical protein
MAMFKEFKRNVPVMGAILLDARMEHVLLVRGFKGASCWGFPRWAAAAIAVPEVVMFRSQIVPFVFDRSLLGRSL